MLRWFFVCLFTSATFLPLGVAARAAPAPFVVGAVFPFHGSISQLAGQEYRGVRIAQQLVNSTGGVDGHTIDLRTRSLDDASRVGPIMSSFRKAGITAVLGAYSSSLSIPASAAAAADGMVYWEAGAVADRLTGRGLPLVFRVGASGSNLGGNSARFIAQHLAPLLHEKPSSIRVAVVYAQDAYAVSVAQAAIRQAHIYGLRVVSTPSYDPYAPIWGPVLSALRGSHPDVLVLASHILDGVAFRRAFLADHLYVKAFIGSTMAQCVPEFGALMGRQAIGVFASDRPPGEFNPAALTPASRVLFTHFARIWGSQTGTAPTEEGLAGFSAGWALFHYVLPRAAAQGSLSAARIAAAARSLNLSLGALPNGAGIRFATDMQHLGQNLRAAAVIWQWQAVRHSVVVWPKVYATGHIRMVPLPR